MISTIIQILYDTVISNIDTIIHIDPGITDLSYFKNTELKF